MKQGAPLPVFHTFSGVAQKLVAKETTVRSWEARGLLRPDAVTSSGHKLFADATVEAFRRERQERA